MRRGILTLLLLLLPVTAVQAQDAQKLYEAMEQKLAKAKAHKIGFNIKGDQGGDPFNGKGTLILATGNRLQMTYEAQIGKQSRKGTTVSDGKTLVRHRVEDGKPEMKSMPIHDKHYEVVSGWLIRAGLFVGMERAESNNPKGSSILKLSEFKMAGKEKIGGCDANVIEYQLALADNTNTLTCRLWLDAQTGMPLKRVLEGDGFRVIETYSQWELDPKLPEDTFTLPK
jgi:outer membrane lipoprotein-sorting protein